MTDIACIVLAAGMGTRMCSQLPKVLHKAAGRSLVGHVISAANDLDAARIVVVVGDGAAPIEAEVRRYSPDARIDRAIASARHRRCRWQSATCPGWV